METNSIAKDILYSRIKACGYNRSEFIEKIGMSRPAFYRKVNGQSEFSLSEIKAIMKVLKLRSPQEIFFSKEVS